MWISDPLSPENERKGDQAKSRATKTLVSVSLTCYSSVFAHQHILLKVTRVKKAKVAGQRAKP
jgi:hypothetical protein